MPVGNLRPPALPETETFHVETAYAPPRPGVIQRGAPLGRYVVLHPLGSGGMGHVYAAFDPELERKVAVKVLSGHLLDSGSAQAAQDRLRREAQAVAKLAHPNVVSVYDVGTAGGRVFLAMELVDGETLRSWLHAGARPWQEVLDLFDQAGKGLAAAHDAGLVHRDFKPGNVMVGRDGRVRVLDFGLARPAADAVLGATVSGAGLGHTDGLAGTPAYMAPEILEGRRPDARADQFSFCAALWEALHGEHPFAGATREQLVHSIRQGRWRQVPPRARVPGWLLPVLRRGLSADPEARYASLAQLLEALRHGARVRRRRRLTLAAVLISAVGLAAFLGWAERSQLCQDAGRRLAGIWDPASRGAIRDALLATGLGYADTTWQNLARTLDAYSAEWVELSTEVCEATHLRGEQSTNLLDVRMACLDDRLYELDAFAGLLRSPDAGLVRRAVAASQDLTNLEGCRDRKALSGMAPPPDAMRAQVDKLRKRLAEARVLRVAGRYPESFRNAELALAEARQLEYPPLLGEAHFVVGLSQGRLGKLDELEDHLIEAVALAEASGHAELRAEGLTSLMIPAFMKGDAGRAEQWGRLAEAAIASLGRRQVLEALRIFYLGVAAHGAGRYEEAIAYLDRYVAMSPNLKPYHRANTANNKAENLILLERYDEAFESLQQGIRYAEEAFSADHPTMAALVANLGELAATRGDDAQALEAHRRALAINENALGPEDPSHHRYLSFVGQDLLELGRPHEAVLFLERALDIAESAQVPPKDAAQVRFNLARAIAGTDPRRAETLARSAREAYVAMRADAEAERVDAWLAR